MTHTGIPYARHTIVVFRDGTPAVDWGNGSFQEILSGRFFSGSESAIGHTISNEELSQLRSLGHVLHFNDEFVYLPPLPEPPRRTIE
jgi:hypothetical protein